MALPQMKTATYLMEVPSTGREIEFRPYTVKEEKVLMIAMESKDQKQTFRALKSVIKDCVKDDIDVSKLTMDYRMNKFIDFVNARPEGLEPSTP